MKVYFTAAISLKDEYGINYQRIVDALKGMGIQVIHEHISNVSMSDIHNSGDDEREAYYRKVLSWIASCDVVVAELSFPSTLNVGHEVTIALEKGKPVIGLYAVGKESQFFKGIASDKFIYIEYQNSDVKNVLKQALDYAMERQDTRFNFFISPKHQNYLDWVAKHRKLPRAVYLRRLIEKDMKENKEFHE